MSEGRIRRTVSLLAMAGIVVGFAVVLVWFIMPGLDRGWLVLGGAVLAVSASVGLISSRPSRHET